MPKLVLNLETYEFCDDKGNTLFKAPLLEVAYFIGSIHAGIEGPSSLQEKFSVTATALSKQYNLDPPLPWFAAMQLTRQIEAEVESLKKTEDTATVNSSAATQDHISDSKTLQSKPNLGASAAELSS